MSHAGNIYRLAVILVGSLIPVFGLWWWHWNPFEVALALWLDGLAKLLLGGFQIMHLPRGFFERLKITVILLIFWGGFMGGHLIAILALLHPDVASASMEAHLASLARDWQWWLVAVALCISYAMYFASHYLPANIDREEMTRLLFQEIRVRVIVVQLTVLGMAFLVTEKGLDPIIGLSIGIILKTLSDVVFEWLKVRTPAIAST